MSKQFFNEIYGDYYNTMAKIIEAAQNKTLDEESLYNVIRETAFAESVIPITDAVKKEKWRLVDSEFKTPLKNKPKMPLTLLQKSFLKAMVCDKRAKLFFEESELEAMQKELSDVEPLFTSEAIEYFDSCVGECNDENFAKKFRYALNEIRNNKNERLEYSQKDGTFKIASPEKQKTEILVLEITDERNACERVMFCFSHLKKSGVERISKNRYRIAFAYDVNEQDKMVDQVLQFGPYVKVLQPASFVEQIKKRLRKQKYKNKYFTC